MIERSAEKIYVLYLEKQNYLIRSQISEGEIDSALAALNDILEGVNLKDPSYERFLYHKAVALDVKGQTLDAFPIFVELFEARPFELNYYRSFQVCINNLDKLAVNMILQNPSNDKILNLHHLLNQYHYPSYRVCEGAATIYGLRGQRDLAKSIISNRLVLSPNDLDVLGSALRIAKILGDLEWISQLRDILKAILKKYPFRYEVLQVESDDFEKMWAKIG